MDLTSFFEIEVSPIEKYFSDKITKNPNMMVPYYLMASYAYYVEDNPIISDSFFDCIAKDFSKKYDMIEHTHKHLITKDMLEAGTYIGEYPPIIKGAVKSVRSLK